MNNIKELNIWKTTNDIAGFEDEINEASIEVLNLSVRSYNALRRAGCNTVGEIVKRLEDDEDSLKRIRNLGKLSEAEIIEAVSAYRLDYKPNPVPDAKTTYLICPSRKTWKMSIDNYKLSERTQKHLREKGINKVGDLFEKTSNPGPDWNAVRELFLQITAEK